MKAGPRYRAVLVPPRLDFLRASARLAGYTPIRPVRGIVLRPDALVEGEEVVIAVPPRRGAPVELLRGSALLPRDAAYARLAISFPEVDPTYLDALLAGAVCAEAGERPVMLLAIGPSGSGKGETPRLAASALGDDVMKLILDSESLEKFRRELGTAAASGRRYLLCDEIGKVRKLGTHVRSLLEISSNVTWRPLFVSGDVLTPLRSMLVLAHLSTPEVFASAPEVCRRMRQIRLRRRTPDWSQTCGGDTAAWRARSPENAQVLNSILTHAVALAAKHGYAWDPIADELGLGRPDDGESFVDEEALVLLYRHVCGRDGRRTVPASGKFSNGRWVELTATTAASIFSRLVTDDEDAVFHLRNRLESIDWTSLLRIADPAIACEVRHHGRQVVCRFRAVERALRGRERLNEQLPEDRRDDVARPTSMILPEPARPATPSTVSVWTDGSCFPNPGPGGYAAVIELDGQWIEVSGGDPNTTNNRMELMGAMVALEEINSRLRTRLGIDWRAAVPTTVRVMSDSQYVIQGAPKWCRGGQHAEAANSDLWTELRSRAGYFTAVEWTWIRGHSGDPGNERADQLAGEARKRAASGVIPPFEVRDVAAPNVEHVAEAAQGDLFELLAQSPDAPENGAAR